MTHRFISLVRIHVPICNCALLFSYETLAVELCHESLHNGNTNASLKSGHLESVIFTSDILLLFFVVVYLILQTSDVYADL